MGRFPDVLAVTLIGGAWVASVAAQTGVDGPSSHATTETAMWVTSIVGFLSLLATQIFALVREHRNRQWDLEDRAAARAQMERNAALQRIETVQTAVELARITKEHRQHILQEISRNTEITQDVGAKAAAAHEAANNFNEKLERLRRELQSKGTQIDTIEETSLDTNEKVTGLTESSKP